MEEQTSLIRGKLPPTGPRVSQENDKTDLINPFAFLCLLSTCSMRAKQAPIEVWKSGVSRTARLVINDPYNCTSISQGCVPKYSKESIPNLRQLSKDGSEEGSSLQRKLRRLASWKSLTKLQKTQPENPEEAVLSDPPDAKRTQKSVPKYSKDSSSHLSLLKHSKDGSEDFLEGSSKPRKLKMFKSWKGFARSQKTQPEIHEESVVVDLPDAQRADDKQGSSTKRRKMFAGLRRKESQRIPIREVEPPRLSDTTHAHCEIVDVRELQHKIKLRERRLRLISDWMRRASMVAIVLSLTVALFGFTACYLTHLEYTVHKAAAQQLNKQWKSQCGRKKLHRNIHGSVHEETDCYVPSISTAEWSDWSTCVNGMKSRWKVMEKDERYVIDSSYYEHHEC